MASSAAPAPSTLPRPLQTAWAGWERGREILERWLEAERDQLALWLPVLLGAGVAAWFVLPDASGWRAAILAALALAAAALAVGQGGRAGRAAAIGALAFAVGVALVWWRAERVAAPVLARPAIVKFEGKVLRVERLPAREMVRVRLAPLRVLPAEDDGSAQKRRPAASVRLPPVVRVNLADADAPKTLERGVTLRLQARLMPPAPPAVPGAYDFRRVAWFDRLGASGKGHAPVEVIAGGTGGDGIRQRLSQHIEGQLPGSAGGIAAALATGDTGAITPADSDAMRRAGLAHLLSVSGLHLTAVVALTMWLALKLLALSPALALRFRLPLIAAGFAAAAAIGYTLLTGSEVPTIRSCVAALLVLVAIALGREAITLRLVAAGAFIVLLCWPESLAGPSFQLSFAAVTAIVALHEHPRMRTWFLPREEAWWWRGLRSLGSLLLTGLVVELALMPIAVYHFHKAGIYGAFANIVAIPLTTFVVMPLEALALLFDAVGLGAPLWWLTGKALALLLWIATVTARAPGAVAALPAMPDGAYALMVAGGLWLALWRTKWRRFGLAPLALGAGWALATPPPDLLVTGDGQHVALRTAEGSIALLRDRAGDYTRDMLAVNGGLDGEPVLWSEQADARCSRDVCLAKRGRWRVLATRSPYLVKADDLVKLCGEVDIVVSERRLPGRCRPRWLKLDKPTLAKIGGVSVTFATGRIVTVQRPGDDHPWATAIRNSGAEFPRAYPARAPGRGRNAADHRRDWRDRAGSWRLRDGSI